MKPKRMPKTLPPQGAEADQNGGMRTRLFLAALLAAAAAAGAQADVVRCTDADGRVSYTDGACPRGTQQSRQVSVAEPVAVIPSPEDARRPAAPPPVSAPPAAPGGVAGSPPPPSGPAIIPRHVDEPRPVPPPEPPVYSWGPDPYYDGGRPIIRPRPPRPVDPGPPPGQRPCNLAGIKRNNC